MTQRDIDRVIVAIGNVWDSSECERDPAAMWHKIMGALQSLVPPAPCRHDETKPDPDSPDDYLVCCSCGATGSVKLCGICSEQFCRCAEFNLR